MKRGENKCALARDRFSGQALYIACGENKNERLRDGTSAAEGSAASPQSYYASRLLSRRAAHQTAAAGTVTPPLIFIFLTLVSLSLLPGMNSSVLAQSDSSSSLHAGQVQLKNPEEKKLFERLLCQCGSCARLPLSTCACEWAEDMRRTLRLRLAAGETLQVIQAGYRGEFGAKAIAIPSDKGLDRALWAVPVMVIIMAGFGLLWLSKRWNKKSRGSADGFIQAAAATQVSTAQSAALDKRLDEELKNLGDS